MRQDPREERRLPLAGRAAPPSVRLGRRALLAAAIAAVLAPPASHAENREYQLKSAFLFNFIKFVDWPAQALPESNPNIRVCVAGRAALAAVQETINGKPVKGKTVVVAPFNGPQDLGNCQVLFISAGEQGRAKSILDAARNASVLTVGESEGFTHSGGIINFTSESNKIRFEINPEAAERSRLSVSSQLLKLAKVVR
jgi:hypothetical protein